MKIKKENRIEWIDYLKAFTCLLVVIGHLIQSLQKANIDNYKDFSNFLNWFIYLFHMPVFFAISGYLFFIRNTRCFKLREYNKYILEKFLNLGIPYVIFYLIFILINIIFSSSVNTVKGYKELVGIINNPMPPYWFLYSLFSIFLFSPIMIWLNSKNQKLGFIIFITLKIIDIFYPCKIYLIHSIMSNGIYFYFGGSIKNKNELDKKNVSYGVLLYIIISFIYYFIIYKFNINLKLQQIINIIFAIGGIELLKNKFKLITKNSFLDTFKKYTFQIYILHTIFAAGIRIMLLKIGITNYIIHIFFGLIFSIYIPCTIAYICEKIRYFNILFFPIKTIKELKEISKCKEKN